MTVWMHDLSFSATESELDELEEEVAEEDLQ
jgi:hypothetical protein